MKINNVPDWAWRKYYMTVRYCDGEWWFYDAWDEDKGEDAMRQCWEEDLELREVDHCEVGRF